VKLDSPHTYRLLRAAGFDKAMTVAKLRGPRERKRKTGNAKDARGRTGKCEGRKALHETAPEAVDSLQPKERPRDGQRAKAQVCPCGCGIDFWFAFQLDCRGGVRKLSFGCLRKRQSHPEKMRLSQRNFQAAGAPPLPSIPRVGCGGVCNVASFGSHALC
jgi:hypothetical protein